MRHDLNHADGASTVTAERVYISGLYEAGLEQIFSHDTRAGPTLVFTLFPLGQARDLPYSACSSRAGTYFILHLWAKPGIPFFRVSAPGHTYLLKVLTGGALY